MFQAVQMEIWCVLLLLGLSTALVCPDGGMCEDRNTCCKNTVGGYGCCPLPHVSRCSAEAINQIKLCQTITTLSYQM
uniref:Granulins domain-containing protein n=1 Tax=Scophthalmus maximus TaxID=52904 RepID=A0A8D3CEX9_SCOMX